MGKMKKNGGIQLRKQERKAAVAAVKQVASQRSGGKKKKPAHKGKGILSAIGGLAGGYFGGPLGANLGMAAGDLISSITGFGAYQVRKNTVSEGNSVPTFKNTGDGMVVCHREFITDVKGSVDFAQQIKLFINPGLLATFPWLSQLATNFEEWDARGLVFEYRPSSGSAISSTSSALGVVVMATDYDVLNPDFTTKQQMESYEYSTSTVPFTGCMHPVECDRNKTVLPSLYIRSSPAVPAAADQRLYDMGKFQLATAGMQSVYTVGELWVSYDMVFRKPRIPTTLAPAYSHFRETPAGTATATNRLGTSGAVATANSTLNEIIPNGTNGLVFSQVGTYLVQVSVVGATLTGGIGFSVGSNMNMLNTWFLDGAATFVNCYDSTAKATSSISSVNVLAAGQTSANLLTFNNAGGLTNGAVDVFVFRVPGVALLAPKPVPRQLPQDDIVMVSSMFEECKLR